MEEIKIFAPAKINLALNITGLLPDGYHQVEMIMQSLALCDELKMRKIDRGIKIHSSVPELPEDRNNLAYAAAELIINETGLKKGVEIFLKKRIPLAAGLAGGSTDAAAVIRGMNRLFGLGLTIKKLQQLASKLGADIPFCIRGGTAFAYGKGDRLKQLPDLPEVELVLITPPVQVSTAEVYREYDKISLSKKLNIKSLAKRLEEGLEPEWSRGWDNVLEEVTTNLVPEVKEIKELLKKMGANFVLMSGSGPSVYGFVNNTTQGEYIINNWPRQQDFITLTRTTGQDFFWK